MKQMLLVFACLFAAGVCAAQDPAPAVEIPVAPEAAPPVEVPAAPETASQAAPDAVPENATEIKSVEPAAVPLPEPGPKPAEAEAPAPEPVAVPETPVEPVAAPVAEPAAETANVETVAAPEPVTVEEPVEAPAEPAPAAEAPAEAGMEAPTPEADPELYLGHPLGLVVNVQDAARVADAVLVDVREPEQYEQAHIAGAVNLPVKSLSEERGGVRNLLRPVDQLVTALAARGITPDSTVIVYTKISDAAELNNAARLFWVLEYLSFPRVHLLDGGLAKWQSEGLPVENGPGQAKAVPVEAVKVTIRPEIIAKRSDVLDLVGGGTGVLVDARPRGYFTGEDKADFVARPGRIPTAVSRPSADLLQGEMFEFKSEEEIREVVKVADGDTSRKTIVYCNSGNNASLGYFGYRLAGYENVSMYDGSMAEWSLNPALAVQTGDPDAAPVAQDPAPEPAPAPPVESPALEPIPVPATESPVADTPASKSVPEPVAEAAPAPEPVANTAPETAPQP